MSNQELPEIELKVTGLPSRGVPYPEGATIKYRNYTWGEVRRASTSKVSVYETLKNALKGIDTSFDKQNLTLPDALYLGILRKISTFSGMTLEVPYVCRKCGSPNTGHLNHGDISFRDLSDSVTALPGHAKLAGKEIEFGPMTVKQYYELSEGRYSNIIGEKIDEVASQACWIKNMSYKDAFELINGLTDPKDFKTITAIDKLLMHDMDFLTFTCSEEKCKFQNKLKLEGREAMLRPFRGGEESDLDGIQFGKRAEPANQQLNESGV
jgi:hypothetical protein